MFQDIYPTWQAIPVGHVCRFPNCTLVKMAEQHCYDGIGDESLFCIETGTIHHFSEYFRCDSTTPEQLLSVFSPFPVKAPHTVTVRVGEDGIDVPVCPIGVTVEITETADGYRHTSRYDHTGRLD